MNYKSKSTSRGFTIVELLIVIVIIGILAALVIVAYTGIQNRAKNTKKISDVRQLQKIIELYHADNGRYPPTPSGYQVSLMTGSLSSYTNVIPNDSTYPFFYVFGGDNAYGIRIYYEGVGYCLVGVNINLAWWSTGQVCPS